MRNLLLGFSALAIVAACSQPAAEGPAAIVMSATAETGATPAEYKLSWSLDNPDASVRIEALSDPDAAAGSGTLVAEAATGGQLTWTAEGSDSRSYFLITPENGAPTKTSIRLLPLEGGRNFRDLGGYETVDGRNVKWGKVYRSGVMNDLTPGDYAYLNGLGIKVVCDFRNAGERANEPTNWSAGAIDYLTFPDSMDTGDNSALFTVFQKADVTAEDVAASMAAAYPGIARDHAAMYEAMFDRLAAGEVPLAFNCSAGKDRTGVAAAFILTVLGVPKETVLADYAMSDKVVDYMKEFTAAPTPAAEPASAAEAAANPYAFLAQLPPEIVAPLMRSDPRYLEAVYADAEAKHGSVIDYIKTELKVTDAEIENIQALLLE